MKKNLKRYLSLLLAITIIFSSAYVGLGVVDFDALFAVRVEAASLSDLTFGLNDDGSYYVNYCKKTATGEMAIPSKYNGRPVTRINQSAFSYCKNITSLIIPSSVRIIDSQAFNGCSGISSIVIPDSVTDIGEQAFANCTKLISVSFGNGLSAISNYMFINCSNLKSVSIPGSVKRIGDYAFKECKNLESIYIASGVETIGQEAFCQCGKLTSIQLPNSVKSMGIRVFRNCSSLKSVVLGDSIPVLEYETFAYCSNLNAVSLGNGIKETEWGAFTDCYNLKSIELPNSIEKIGMYTFSNSGITHITLPDSVTFIEEYAFSNCDDLQYVYYKGTPKQFDNIEVESSGNGSFQYAKHCCNYIEPANGDTTYGNYGDGFTLSNYMFEYYSIDGEDGVQLYYDYLYAFNNFSGSEILVNSSEGSTMEAGIDAWYAIKCTANPGYALNALNYQQQYEMLVYGVLFDALYNEDLSNTTYNNVVTKSSAFTSDLVDKWNMADVLDKTNLNGTESQQIKDAAIEFIEKNNTKWTALGEYTSLISKVSGSLDKIVKPGVSVYNMTQKVAMLSQLMEVGDEVISYLYLLKDNATDRYLRAAIQSVIDSMSNDWVGIVEKVVLDAQFEFSKKIVDKLIDKAWDLVCKVNPFLSGMAIGDVVGTFVCNSLFATEDMISQYSNMKKILELKKTVSETQMYLYDICKCYTQNKDTMMWVFSLYFMNTLHKTDLVASTEFARITLKAGLINCIKNTFSSYQEQQYDEYKESADAIIEIHNEKFEILMGNDELKLKLCEVYPQYYSFCYPTPESDFTYKVEGDSVTVTAVKNGRCDIVIPDEIEGKPVTVLAEDMLRGFDYINIIVVGKNVKDVPGITTLYYNSFGNLNDLKYVYVDEGNSNFCSVDGVMFSKNKKILYKYGSNNRDFYTIPAGVTTIRDTAFYGCESLVSIEIPDTLTNVEDYAFGKCNQLSDVYYNGSVAQRQKIKIGTNNNGLINANWHYPTISKPDTPKVKAINTIAGMKVTWNAVSGATKYVVYRRLGTSSTWSIIATTTGLSFEDKGSLVAGNYYVYSVKAYNSVGTPSDYVKANCASVQRVVAPYTKAANAIGGINVTWGKVAGANKYVVLRRIGTESTWKTLCTTTGTSFLDKNVTPGIYYIYSIRAVNNTGYSEYDINKRITVQRVVAPYTKAANAVSGINVTWGKVAGASKYVVLRRIGTESTWKTLCTTTGTSYLDKNVTPGIYYIYSIRAVNGTGYSEYDINKRVTIQRILTPKASAVNKSNGIQLSWNTVTSATKYNVYRRIGGTSNWVYVGTTTGNTLLDKGVVKGKSYAYSIRAINGTGYSAYDSSKCAAIKH